MGKHAVHGRRYSSPAARAAPAWAARCPWEGRAAAAVLQVLLLLLVLPLTREAGELAAGGNCPHTAVREPADGSAGRARGNRHVQALRDAAGALLPCRLPLLLRLLRQQRPVVAGAARVGVGVARAATLPACRSP